MITIAIASIGIRLFVTESMVRYTRLESVYEV